jgi:hypothetical protein
MMAVIVVMMVVVGVVIYARRCHRLCLNVISKLECDELPFPIPVEM